MRYAPWAWLLLMVLVTGQCAGAEDLSTVPPEAPVRVRVGLNILDFNYIRSAEQSYSLSAYLYVVWNDPRLAHPGPGVRTIATDKAWTPTLDLINSQDFTRFAVSPLRVTPEGEVTYWVRLKAVENTPFDLYRFPFDSTDLQFRVMATEETAEQVRLVADGDLSALSPKLFDAEWDITSFEGHEYVESWAGANRYVAEFTVGVQRRYQWYIFVFFVPLALIVLTSWTVLWTMPPNIQVTTTVMLGVITHRLSLSTALPRLRFLTFLDGMFLFSLFWVVLSNVIVALVLRLDEKKNPGWRDRLRRGASLVLPIGYFLGALILAHIFGLY